MCFSSRSASRPQAPTSLAGSGTHTHGASPHLAIRRPIHLAKPHSPCIHRVFAHYTPFPSVGYWWLPLAGLGILLVALYVDKDLGRLQKDIESLEKLRYNYKKV